jgi:gamma-glutamyl:cysteine ligase YbdK (ATP-grasp superfamily)
MGQEIARSHFKKPDFQAFESRLQEETALVRRWFEERLFTVAPNTGGFELEAWLVDDQGLPAPINQVYLERLNNPQVVPELSVFNVELNTEPRVLHDDALSRMQSALEELWALGNKTAAELNASLLMIGILPTVQELDLNMANMSQMIRYRALNEQVLRQRHGIPFVLDIHGREWLHAEHQNLMLEAAATSLQVHLQVNQVQAAQYFNAALILSAPMVAVAANSPFLFGRDLWDETRIPVFEQALAVSNDEKAQSLLRVTFGRGYVRQSLLELFLENLECYPALLPMALDEPLEQVGHLRLQNGTIWRWNRPLIGFEANGTPHLRIEHRVMAAGPSVLDTIANTALFYGLVHFYGEQAELLAALLPFEQCRKNFYTAARKGLNAEIVWLDGKPVVLRQLLLEKLLPLAKQGLESLDINRDDIQTYLGVIEARVSTGRTGASWQRDFVASHGPDMCVLTKTYLEQQRRGTPVHEWSLRC